MIGVLLNLYVAMSVVSGAVGLHGVRDFYATKAVVQAKAQLALSCPAMSARPHLAHSLPSGPMTRVHEHRQW